MKRANLFDRVGLIIEREEEMARAACDFARAQQNSMATAAQRECSRKDLLRAAVRLGLVFKRYLGGRE